MIETPSRTWTLVCIAFLGAFSQVSQAVLIREALVVLYGNEVSLGLFYAGWLVWIGLGSLAVARRGGRFASPGRALAAILAVLPLALVLEVLALRTARLWLEVPVVELVPLGQMAATLFLVTAPAGLLLGAAFPFAGKALERAAGRSDPQGTAGRVSGLYAAEALGAFGGGLAFTFLMVEHLGLVAVLGWVALVLGGLLWTLGGWGRGGLGWLLTGALLLLPPVAERLDAGLERLRFASLQPGMELLDALETRYGHVALARLGGQISVVRDGHLGESFPLPRETAQTAAYVYAQAGTPRRILVLEGFAGGLPAELLRYPLTRVDQVLQDRRAFEHLRPWLPPEGRKALEDARLHLHFQDGRRFLAELPAGTRYDLVLALDATPSNAQGNRYFTREFFRTVAAHLSPRGVYCTQVEAASNYVGRDLGGYTASVFATLNAVWPAVAIRPGDTHLYCASARGQVSEDPEVLKARYEAIELAPRTFPPEGFYSLLPNDRIQYLRERFVALRAPLDTDARPVTYFLNMILWGRFTAAEWADWIARLQRMGPWPYLVPLWVGLVLWLGRRWASGGPRLELERQAALAALAALGLLAMAAQLVILLGYQAHVGFMFERVALLNGLFMTGLALGAGLLGRPLARGARVSWLLGALLLLVALGMWSLPRVFDLLAGAGEWQEPGYWALSVLAGVLTGAGFPLGLHQIHRAQPEVLGSTGAVEAADHLGGALGALLTGSLWIPLLGVEGAGGLMAAVAGTALVPVLVAGRLRPVGGLAPRARPSFPWPRLSLALLGLGLCGLGWYWVAALHAEGPRVRFDPPELQEVSGSVRFAERPGPRYLGWDREEAPGPPDSLSLSTLVLASGVKGYAGPLDILFSLDRQGRIRGLRYIASRESPAYIGDIQAWLDRLKGWDLTRAPLDLGHVDAISGATLSSRAALEAIGRSARMAGAEAFGLHLQGEGGGASAPAGLASWRFWVTLALLAAFVPVYLWGGERARLALMAASLALLGFGFNGLVTEMDLIHFTQGLWPAWPDNAQRWLVWGFVGLAGVLLGQVWCGYLCPFGALQEFVSRLGRHLRLRRYARRPLERALRYLKYLLLVAMLWAVWLSGDETWAGFDPMQSLFSGRFTEALGWVTGLALGGSLFYVRFWCRYLCPLGAFLSLSNKLALLQSRVRGRRFDHCDLGVRHEYDLDCLRCNRCLWGEDTHVRKRGRRLPMPRR